jgi:hypothetical protein
MLLFIGLVLLGVGLSMVVDGSEDARDARRVEASSLAEVADFEAVVPGKDVLLDGTLGGAAGAGSQRADERARSYSLVIYMHQRWVCKRDDDDDYKGSWQLVERVAPQVITLDGGAVPIALAQWVAMTGDRFDSPVLWRGDGRRCDGQTENSMRVVGYRVGDPICVLGQKRDEGSLLIEGVHSGDQDSFIADLEGRAHRKRRLGGILLGVGLLFGCIAVGIMLSSRLVQSRTSLLLLSLL